MTCLPLPRGCRLVLQALASRINVQNAGFPPPSFDVQQPQLDNTRASSMIAAADTHTTRPKLVCLSRTLGGVKLGGIIEESHTTPITFNEASGRRCCSMPSLHPRTQPRDPAIWVWRSLCRSPALLQNYIAHPRDFTKFFFFLFLKRRDQMRWPVFAIVLDVICDSRG